MITICLCMIVKNEEDSIGRCLESVKDLVEEINIIDTGSSDTTKEVVSKYTDRIFDFEWIDDFSKARNYAFQKASKDYIFWLDADDVLLEADRKKFKKLKETLDSSIDTVTMDYHLSVDQYGNVTSRVKRNRLVKREKQFQWIGMVHEYLEVWGNIFNSDIAVTHQSNRHDADRNLLIYEKQLAQGKDFTPRDLFYFANELKDHQMHERAIYYYEKFLKTKMGWIEDNISTCSKLADCYFELGNFEKEIESILRSFRFDSPRPEFCCRLGFYFFQKKEFVTSIFWYKLATQLEVPKDNWGFVNPTFSTWLPHLQLCVCYDQLGEYELAYRHNEIALQYRPEDPSVLHNKAYLETVLQTGEAKGTTHGE
ncbi:glycosyltransferase [Priestia aryabhattai]|uniref:tetratricopeptide repeat-containing glycosyltransferase family 2 protein n=1 Tax=Priestia aryabhattai TaxID=412384 RepID=UPI003562974E